jgi:hypothetical protein
MFFFSYLGTFFDEHLVHCKDDPQQEQDCIEFSEENWYEEFIDLESITDISSG